MTSWSRVKTERIHNTAVEWANFAYRNEESDLCSGYVKTSVAEPEPVEPKLFWDLEPEPEPKINFN